MSDPRRLGKWMVLEATGARVLVHFGMTGALAWTGRLRRGSVVPRGTRGTPPGPGRWAHQLVV